MNRCQKPTGWLGRFILWAMNLGHSKLTDWGLAHTGGLVEERLTSGVD